MSTTVSAGLLTGLPRTEAGFLLPPKLVEEDRIHFERAVFESTYRSRYFQPRGWVSSALRRVRIYLRSFVRWVMVTLNRTCGKGVEFIVPVMVNDLRRLRYKGEFFAADEKIRTTPQVLLAHPIVAAEAANVYLDFGHVREARAVIDGSVLPTSIKQTGWMYREEITVLALISLCIDVQRTLDFKEAQFVFENIEDVFLRLDCRWSPISITAGIVTTASDAGFSAECSRISRYRQILNGTLEELPVDKSHLPEAVVLIEYWSITLHLLFIQEGFCGNDPNLSHRAQCLHRYLKSRGLKWLEADLILLFAQGPGVLAPFVAITNLMDEFSERLYKEDGAIKAHVILTWSELAWAEDRSQAQKMLNDAELIYKNSGSYPGSLCTTLNRLRFRTEGSIESTVKSLISLSEEFLSIGMMSNFFSALYEATNYSYSYTELLPLVEVIEARWMLQVNSSQNQLMGEKFRLLQCHLRLGIPLNPAIWQARNILSTYLGKYPEAITPRFQTDALIYLGRCHENLSDMGTAVVCFERALNSLAAKVHQYIQSQVYCHLVKARFMRNQQRLQEIRDRDKGDIERSKCLQELKIDLTGLNKWLLEDSAHNRPGLVREKTLLFGEIRSFIREGWPAEQDIQIPDVSNGGPAREGEDDGHSNINALELNDKFDGLGDVNHLMRVGRASDGVRLASAWLEGLKRDEKTSKSDLAYGYHVCAYAHACAIMVPALIAHEIVLHIGMAIDLYGHCMSLIQEANNSDLLITIAFPYLFLLDRYTQADPLQKEMRLQQGFRYILSVERIIAQFREASSNSAGVDTMLTDRRVSAQDKIIRFYKTAVWFCLSQGCYWEAWHRVQLGRGVALLNALLRNSYYDVLEKIVQDSPELRRLLLDAAALKHKVQQTPLSSHERENTSLKLLLDNIKRKSPILAEIIDLGDSQKPVKQSDLPKIASALNWLPKRVGIYHIDWFVMPSPPHRIMIFVTNIRDSTLKLGTVDLTLQEIEDWKASYLVFPTDRPKPLETKKSALRLLGKLVAQIADVTKEGDLLILTPPAELSLIPLHGIPINGIPMIERNSVVYSSSLTLNLRCLERTRRLSGSPERSLKNAAFTAAYEENDAKKKLERKEIFQSIDIIAQDLGAPDPISGQTLTRHSMKSVLISSCWIHYHGHAQYSNSNILDQGLVLSDVIASADSEPIPSSDELIKAEEVIAVKPCSLMDQAGSTVAEATEADKAMALLGVEPTRSNPLEESEGPYTDSTRDSTWGISLSHTNQQVQDSSSETVQPSTGPSIPEAKTLLSEIIPHAASLTVKDIFTIDLRQHNPFICLIACDSGVQEVSAGDEPLGILSALFCQGASGAIGTLWPIESSVGRTFTRHFYGALLEQIKANEKASGENGKGEGRGGEKHQEPERILDLASAMREGVQAVRREKDDPYSWAAFVLHGSGFYCY